MEKYSDYVIMELNIGGIMFLEEVIINNYKTLDSVKVKIDKNHTIIVGRNNSGKTSFLDIIRKVIQGRVLKFDTYPLKLRRVLYENIEKFLLNKINYDELLKSIPITTIKFFINYEDVDENQYLGNLSPFIIDIDETNTVVEIKASYEMPADEKVLSEIFVKLQEFIKDNEIKECCRNKFTDELKSIIKQNYFKLFALKIYAVNPKNEEDFVLKSQQELNNLFPIYFINAERNLDENGIETEIDPFNNILSEINKANFVPLENEFSKKIADIRELVSDENNNINVKIKEKMDELVKSSIKFGYPNAEELKFTAETNVDISSSLVQSTKLLYNSSENAETLPSTNNGLGYKNLIKIELLMASFCNIIRELGEGCIPLLFIEEPESHMHPQLQRKFIEYLSAFLSQITQLHVQAIITTHSSYIVNVVDLSCVRYALRIKDTVLYKDVNLFILNYSEDYKFIKKFLRIEMCEIFFADKLILVEGTCERLLLPKIIENMAKNKLFSNESDNLLSQYYSIIEIGGAYAYKFLNFINFLQIPTLIITDIDSAKKTNNEEGKITYKKAPYSKSQYSTNATLKHWLYIAHRDSENSINNANKTENEHVSPGYVKLEDLKSINKTANLCHIEYQIEEEGLCGRSLEEAIMNVNRGKYHLSGDITDEDLENQVCNISKTEFAIDLLIDNENFNIPLYIKNGLIWLDNPVLGEINE